MRRAERLDAPRVWLPRGGRRGWVRAACVGTLVVTAGAILLLPRADAGPDGGAGLPTPTDAGLPTAGLPTAGLPTASPGAERSAGPAGSESGAIPACRSGEFVPPHGAVGFPLRLPDPAVLAVLRAGQHVDVLVRSDGGTADVVAADLAVLCADGTAGEPDGVLYLAAPPTQATALAAIGPGARLSVTVLSP